MHSNLDADFRDLCRRQGWKCTAQRRAVYACLYGNHEHPTADAVWRAVRSGLPDLSLDSVYRILGELVGAGVLRRLDSGDVMRFDPDTSSHDHFVCLSCGQVFDFKFLDAAGAADACSPIGEAQSLELQVRGKCRRCLERERSAPVA